ncbi:hypothetical protein [Melghirimyces algeriensis]|uniref:Uncharacterized protein n=1 Tax=Melghirimyces algeriensis TaxID=910412 RepID=A0A521E016_9BACL|nr:hypothetical protein [Melghirimyces algeriensis]SMO77329.1 hypothetical protein SAMN06264849_10782 [Melghirimyces algeriensis]
MKKDICKWILNTLSDEDLAGLTQTMNIKLDGFRQIHPEHVKRLRPRLIHQMLKPSNLKLAGLMAESEGDFDKIRHMNRQTLYDRMAQGEMKPSLVLTALITSSEAEHQTLAESLYEELSKSGHLEKWQHQYKHLIAEYDTEELDSQSYKEQMIQLKQEAEQATKKVKKTEKKWSERYQRLQKETQKLTNDLHRLKEENKKLMRSIQQTKQELQQRDKELAEQREKDFKNKKKLDQLKEKMSVLEEENRELRKRKKGTEPESHSTSFSVQTGKRIVILGNPKNSKINQQLKQFPSLIVDSSEIESIFEENKLQTSDQIWLLTYNTSPQKQYLVRTHVEEKNLKEFSNFQSLYNHLKTLAQGRNDKV